MLHEGGDVQTESQQTPNCQNSQAKMHFGPAQDTTSEAPFHNSAILFEFFFQLIHMLEEQRCALAEHGRDVSACGCHRNDTTLLHDHIANMCIRIVTIDTHATRN